MRDLLFPLFLFACERGEAPPSLGQEDSIPKIPIHKMGFAHWDVEIDRTEEAKAAPWQIQCRQGPKQGNEKLGPMLQTKDIPIYPALKGSASN